MSSFRLDAAAENDLAEIYDYIARDSCAAADRVIDSFREKFKLLPERPLLGELRTEIAPDLRSFVAGNYVVFYRPAKTGVEIARILHAARDVDAQE